MRMDGEDYIQHYGTPRRSGRYPWGSGGDITAARSRSFMQELDKLRKEGMSEGDIARGFGMSIAELRANKSIAVNEIRQHKINQAARLADKGLSTSAIGKAMGINESSVRALRAPGAKDKADILHATANMLKDQVDKKGLLDVGAGTHHFLDISKDKLTTAIALLKTKFGYTEHEVQFPQLGSPGNFTTTRVLAKPGVDTAYVRANKNKIQTVQAFSKDKGRSYLGIQEPLSIHPNRIAVRWAEDGGAKADGVIYVREGVKDVSIGDKRYAQVRVKVGKDHFLKGMAVYSKDIPDGADLVFHTNKPKGPNKLAAMKPLKDDPDNPFGAVVRQMTETTKAGKEIVTSAMNKVGLREGQYEEGGWDEWSRVLPSQMLSKQRPELARKQLDMTHERRTSEYEEIKRLTNPAVKKRLLESFADETDSAAVHLKAANMPRQANKVLLPVPQMKDTEIHAPTFNNGERVSLVRFPHAGPFEIPELTVNNRNPHARRLLGPHAEDAVGINHRVAQRLSGADFDGDTVLVIPNNRGEIRSQPPLEGLKGFDPIRSYPPYDGMKTIDGGTFNVKTGEVHYPKGKTRYMQTQMGEVSNLITDMTVKGAGPEDMARAVRHSMVIIDSEKHALDYKESARQNNIKQLKEKYQAKDDPSKPAGGASTLLSRAGSHQRIPDRKPRPARQGGPIDPATGKRVFVDTGKTTRDRKTGRQVPKLVPHEKLALTDDAHTLAGPGTTMEKLYADHSNRLKSLANRARKDTLSIKSTKVSDSAKKAYAPQVASLHSKLRLAERNAPLERQAQRLAKAVVDQKRRDHPEMSDEDLKKIRFQALNEARDRTGAGKPKIEITTDEWQAIQAAALTNNVLNKILTHADLDLVKQHATPRTKLLMTSTKTARAKSMLELGYTQAEVASQLGVSLTTLKDSLGGG